MTRSIKIMLPVLFAAVVLLVLTLAEPGALQLLWKKCCWESRDSEFYMKRGEERLRRRDYDGAISDFTAALRLKPDSPSAYFRRAQAEVAIGEYQAAIADYTSAIRLKPLDTSIYYARSIARMKMGDSLGAVEDADKTCRDYMREWICDRYTGERLNDKYVKAYVDRAVSKFEKADYDGAIADCTKTEELYGRYWRPSYWQGRALSEKGEIAEAVRCYESAENTQWFYYHNAYDRALEAAKKEDHKAYLINFDEMKRLKKELAPVYYHSARACARLGRKRLMLMKLGEAIEVQPELWFDAHEDEAFRAFRDDPEFTHLGQGW